MSLSLNRLFPVSSCDELTGYEFLRNTKAYLASKLLPAPRFKDNWQKPELKELTRTFGFASKEKFLQQKKQWDSLKTAVPSLYYEMQGVDFNALDLTVNLDWQEFDTYLNRPRYPSGGRIKSGPFVVSVPFEVPLRGESVMLKELKESFRCSLRQPFHLGYRDFLEIEVCGPDNPVKFYYRVPELQVRGKEVTFSRIIQMNEPNFRN